MKTNKTVLALFILIAFCISVPLILHQKKLTELELNMRDADHEQSLKMIRLIYSESMNDLKTKTNKTPNDAASAKNLVSVVENFVDTCKSKEDICLMLGTKIINQSQIRVQ
jgi:hypothetical protein